MVDTLLISIAVLVVWGTVSGKTPLLQQVNLEKLAFANKCVNYKELGSADRSIDFTTVKDNECDGELTVGWYRFTDAAGSHMATECVPPYSCNSKYPGWLRGGHPVVAQGTVLRTVCFHVAGNCCYASLKILVKNCGKFYVYLLFGLPCPFRYCGGRRTVTPTPELSTFPSPNKTVLGTFPSPNKTVLGTFPSPNQTELGTFPSPNKTVLGTFPSPNQTELGTFPPPLASHKNTPDECSRYKILTNKDRSVSFYDPYNVTGDFTLPTQWYRFAEGAGTKMADRCVPRFHCGTHAPGFLLGGHPTDASSQQVKVKVCFHWQNSCCYFQDEILVRQCDGFFVYKLRQLGVKFLRYCGNDTASH